MRVAYILDRPELCGGVKVVFQHANLLIQRGVKVSVIAIGAAPDWIDCQAEYIDLTQNEGKQQLKHNSYDLVVATYWTTLSMAEDLQLGPIVHYCQGYEASYPHLQNQWEEIRNVYGKKFPCFAVSDFLKQFLILEHDKQVVSVPPCLDDFFTPKYNKTTSTPFKILLSGIFECNWKGVITGLQVVQQLREAGYSCELTRISLIPISDEERSLLTADHYICAASPEVVAKITRESDLVLFPSLSEEGFGLPLLEAMASGVPVVASDIPSVRQITEGQFPLCDPVNSDEFSQQALVLMDNPELYQQRVETGKTLAKKYQQQAVSDSLMDAIHWAIGLKK